jgi:hypothetical protein
MKKVLYLFSLLCLIITSLPSCTEGGNEDNDVKSKYVSKVFEFMPAPGQFTNTSYPKYEEGNSAQDMIDKATNILVGGVNNFVSLGAYGGYIVVGFDQPIVNIADSFDFKVYGNAFLNSAEPGIVMVSRDNNANGLPDDKWYEIKGSEYNNSTLNYSISYIRPSIPNEDIPWFDNQGGSGMLSVVSGYKGASYYPLWISADTLTFTGTLLPPNVTGNDSIGWNLPPYDWGYADNQSNQSDGSKINLDWAVDENGNRVNLEQADFIKIYTGVMQSAGWLGETSAEFAGVEILH